MKLAMFLAPAILCAVIAVPALLDLARRGHNWSQALLYAFLPGCFLLMAGILIRMNRDISRLRRRLARLEGKVSPGSALHDGTDTSRLARDEPSGPPASTPPPA